MRCLLAFLVVLPVCVQAQVLTFNLVPEATGADSLAFGFNPRVTTQPTEARRSNSNAGPIDWSHQGLRKLPKAVDTLYWRPFIDISHNQMRRLGPKSKWLNTDSLDLSENRFRMGRRSVPTRAFSKLTYLDLSDNRIREFDQRCLGPNLAYLDLSNNMLETFGLRQTQGHPLRELNLAGNELLEFPSGLCYYDRLEVLDLSRNHIVSIPSLLGKAKSLQELDLRGNRIAKIPSGLRKCQCLRKVDLRGNPLDKRAIAKLKRYLPEDCELLVDAPV